MVIVGGALGRLLGHEGGALINGISALNKNILQISLAPSTLWGHSGNVLAVNQEEGPHPASLPPWSWIIQPLELWENNSCGL